MIHGCTLTLLWGMHLIPSYFCLCIEKGNIALVYGLIKEALKEKKKQITRQWRSAEMNRYHTDFWVRCSLSVGRHCLCSVIVGQLHWDRHSYLVLWRRAAGAQGYRGWRGSDRPAQSRALPKPHPAIRAPSKVPETIKIKYYKSYVFESASYKSIYMNRVIIGSLKGHKQHKLS
jgi:hypothetical protein